MPANQYDPTDTSIRQDDAAQQQAAVATDRTINVPAPAEVLPVEDTSRVRKLDNGFAIW